MTNINKEGYKPSYQKSYIQLESIADKAEAARIANGTVREHQPKRVTDEAVERMAKSDKAHLRVTDYDRIRELKGPQDETDWNNGEVDILLAHPASCAYGLNLQAGGHHLIWFGLNWSLELYQQANKRLHRQGQQYPVIAHHLVVEGGMDADVMTALADKSGTQEMLMEALKARIEKVRSA